MALVLVVFLCLALTLLAHGTFLLAGAAGVEAALIGDAQRARRAALAGLDVLERTVPDGGDSRRLALPAGLAVELQVVEAGGDLIALESRAEVGRARVRARQLAWRLRPWHWLAGLPGWSVSVEGAATTAPPGVAPPLSCAGLPSRPAWHPHPVAMTPLPSLARLDSAELRRRLAGTGRWHPGPLVVVRDTVSGVLATPGAVRVAPGGLVQGLVLAGRDVHVEAGGEVRAAVLAGGALRVSSGGNVAPDPCAALAALRGETSLLRPLPLPGTRGFSP